MTSFTAKGALSEVFSYSGPHVTFQGPSILSLSNGDLIVGLVGDKIAGGGTSGAYDISGIRLDPSDGSTMAGTRDGSIFELHDQSQNGAYRQHLSDLVELDDGTYLSSFTTTPPHQGGYVTYRQHSDAEVFRFDGDDSIVGDKIEPAEVSGTEGVTELLGGQQRYASSAALDGKFVTAWFEGHGGTHEGHLKFRFYDYDSSGVTAGSTTTVVTGTYTYTNPASTFINYAEIHSPHVEALADGGFAVSWIESDGWKISPGAPIYMRLYEEDGTARTDTFQVSLGATSSYSVAALADGDVVVTWHRDLPGESDPDILQSVISAEGDVLVQSQQVNSFDDGQQAFSKVAALESGGWVITWDSNGHQYVDGMDTLTDPFAVIAQVYRADGTADGGEIVVSGLDNGVDRAPNIAAIDGGFASVYVEGSANPNVDIDGIVAGGYWEADTTDDTVTGTGGDDTIYTAWGDDVISGDGGNDYLFGDAGDDLIGGGAGNDTLWGAAGADTLSGGAGNDLIVLGSGDDSVDGGAGQDTLSVGGGIHDLVIDLSTQSFSGGAFAGDTITGIESVLVGGGDDSITGSSTDNDLDAGGGDDTLLGGAGDDILSGATGDDVLYGGADNDTLLGGHGADTLSGGAGDDLISGGDGGDVLSGGTGTDVLSYAGDTAGVAVNLGGGSTSGGEATGDSISGFENLAGGSGGDSLTGDGGANILWGNAGDDVLAGGDGSDSLFGGDEDDLLSGGAASDQLDGGDGRDTLYGGAGADILSGGADHDTLVGGNAADTLYGGSGDDVYVGSASEFYGDVLFDYEADEAISVTDIPHTRLATVSAGSGVTTVTLYEVDGTTVATTFTVNGEYNSILLHDDGAGGSLIEFDPAIVGTTGADAISGTVFDDEIWGLSGDDTISALVGDDLVTAHRGADIVYGGDGADTLSGGEGGDILSGGTAADVLYGGAGGDQLYGGEGADLLSGGFGNDTLEGGAGADTLVGGTGNPVDLSMGAGEIFDWTEGKSTVVFDDIVGGYAIHDTASHGWHGINESVSGLDNAESQTISIVAKAGTKSSILFQALPSSDVNVWFDLTDGTATLRNSSYPGSAWGSVELDDDWWQVWITITPTYTTSSMTTYVRASSPSQQTYSGDGSATVYVRDFQIEEGVTVPTLPDTLLSDDTDMVSYVASSAGVDVDLAAGTGSGGDADGDVLSGFHGVIGSGHADTLVGDGEANLLSGGDGADVLSGATGADTLVGGAGNDTIVGGGDADRFVFSSGDGDDTFLDFDDTADTIDLEGGLGFADNTDLADNLASDGSGGSVITFDTGEIIRLVGVDPANVDVSLFV